MEDKRKIVKQKMIESAAREFAALGYARANINTISEKAGYGKGTIYNYFKNKTCLLIEVIRFASYLSSEMAQEKMVKEKDLIKKLYFSIYAHFEFCCKYEELMKVLIREGYSSSPEIQKEILYAMDECYQLTMEIIREGKKKKLFSPGVDEFTAANFLAGMLFHHDCTCWILKGKIGNIEEETDKILNYFLNGICYKKGDGK